MWVLTCPEVHPVQGWGQVQLINRLCFRLDEGWGSG